MYAIIDSSPGQLGDLSTPSAKVFVHVIRQVLLREWGDVTLAEKADLAISRRLY